MMESTERVPDELDTRPTGGLLPSSHVPNTAAPPPPGEAAKSVEATLEETYSTRNKGRGRALVINQVTFKANRVGYRAGSNRDRDSICDALFGLQFEVSVLDDPSRQQLLSEIHKLAEEDHSQHDCLVIVVMTHGSKNELHASDGTYHVDRLWEPFLGKACPSLLGKPKLFFIQACRGDKFDAGAELQADCLMTDAVDSRAIHADPEVPTYVIPTMADLLVMYSTYEDHYSWRNPANGSWFIQSLSAELRSNGRRKELLHLLTGVSRRVAYNFQSNVPDNAKMHAMKQMPCIVSMLTKTLYFPPK